ncbi:TSN3 protein, partial [Bucco capensis]|nr:TSN3 protein [Bucco capensis]
RPYAQSLLKFLGFMSWGAAAVLAFGGISVILMCENYRYLFQESFWSLPGWLALLAAFILLPIGLLAISISAKSSSCQQGTLMYLLLVVFCLEMSSAVLVHPYLIQMVSELKSNLDFVVYQHNGAQHPSSVTVDVVQRKLQCCGVQHYTDWLNTTAASWHLPAEKAHVPESCCKENYPNCTGDLTHPEQLFQEGCAKKLEEQLHFVMLYTFWCCIVLSVLELLVAVSNGFLMQDQPFDDLSFL